MEDRARIPDPVRLRLDQLQLDSENPRLPEEAPTDELAIERYIAETYDVIELGRSMSAHGYFSSEPVIAIQPDPHIESYVVVEGNRRLVAARLLRDATRAAGLDEEDEWQELAANAVDLGDEIPVVIAPTRDAVAPIIGYRHISGIEPWDPYQKARF